MALVAHHVQPDKRKDMNPRFANLLTKARAAFDLLKTEGPGALRRLADVNDRVTEAIRRAAEFIEQNGAAVSFATPEAARQQDDAEALMNECFEFAAAQQTKAMATATGPTGAAAATADAIDPMELAQIAIMIGRLIYRALHKGGRPVEIQAPGFQRLVAMHTAQPGTGGGEFFAAEPEPEAVRRTAPPARRAANPSGPQNATAPTVQPPPAGGQ